MRYVLRLMPAPMNRNGRFCCAIAWHAAMTAANSEEERYCTSSMNNPTAVCRAAAASAIATGRRGRSCCRLPPQSEQNQPFGRSSGQGSIHVDGGVLKEAVAAGQLRWLQTGPGNEGVATTIHYRNLAQL